MTFYRKRSTFQNVWRQSSGTCTWTLTSNVLKSTPFPIERHIYCSKLTLKLEINFAPRTVFAFKKRRSTRTKVMQFAWYYRRSNSSPTSFRSWLFRYESKDGDYCSYLKKIKGCLSYHCKVNVRRQISNALRLTLSFYDFYNCTFAQCLNI